MARIRGRCTLIVAGRSIREAVAIFLFRKLSRCGVPPLRSSDRNRKLPTASRSNVLRAARHAKPRDLGMTTILSLTRPRSFSGR